MINAKKLEYKTITDALLAGKFYSVTGDGGAQIKELWYEDGKVHITCSPASKIILSTGIRHQGFRNAKLEGVESVTEATFDVEDRYGYFRITVIDKEGNCADTNAYFMDSLLSRGITDCKI